MDKTTHGTASREEARVVTASLVVLEVHESLRVLGRRDWLWSHRWVCLLGPLSASWRLKFPDLNI